MADGPGNSWGEGREDGKDISGLQKPGRIVCRLGEK